MSNIILLMPSAESEQILITNSSGIRWFFILMVFGEASLCNQLGKAQFRAWTMRSKQQWILEPFSSAIQAKT